jgi:hypothetical protein
MSSDEEMNHVKQYQEIDGVAVIEQTQAYGRHPHPDQNGKQVPFSYVVHLLLANGSERYGCTLDDACDYVAESVQSVVAHLSKHNPDRCKPTTPEPVLRDVIRTVRTLQRDLGKHFHYGDAAADLNRRGVKPANSPEWTDSAVRSLFTRYADEFPRVGPRPRKPLPPLPNAIVDATRDLTSADVAQLGSADKPATYDRDKVVELLNEFDRELEQARETGREIRNLLIHMPEVPNVDPVIVEKARRFDTMQSMLRS